MKLIFGLLVVVGVGIAQPALLDAVTKVGQRKHFYRSFYSGFPEGSVVSLFFKPLNIDKNCTINFYKEYMINTNEYNEILAQILITRTSEGASVSTDSYVFAKEYGHEPQKSEFFQRIILMPEILRNSAWWRVDLYKLEGNRDNQMIVFVQGVFAGIRHFYLDLDKAKSVYVLDAEPENAWFENYNFQFSILSEPISHETFETLVTDWLPHTEDYNVNGQFVDRFTPFNTIRKPKIQFIPNNPNAMNSDGIFTFYHDGEDRRLRKSYVDILNKRTDMEDTCTVDICSPTECVTDGSTGDIEHIWIHRLGDKLINVGNVLVGPDRVKNLMNDGFPGTMCHFENHLMMDLDQPFKIYGMNGAAILHASIFKPEDQKKFA